MVFQSWPIMQTIEVIYHSITVRETAQKAGDYAEDMPIEMLATTVGLPDELSCQTAEEKNGIS